MSGLRTLIVDDERAARERLKRLVAASTGVELVGEASNGIEALELCEKLRPELVFLDVQMPELGGLGVARSLRQDPSPALIFSTAFDRHALAAFDAHAIDYLVKPVRAERLAAALVKARAFVSGRAGRRAAPTPPSDRLAVRCGAKFVILALARVPAILAKDHYAAILAEGREYLSDDPLEDLAPRLEGAGFVRTHRGSLVNLKWIRELQRQGDRKYDAILSDAAATRVPISRERLDSVKAALGLS